jgi:hypothetical protein
MRYMLGRSGRLLSLGVLVGGVVAAAQPARADFEILVTESGGPTIPIVNDGPLDTNTTTLGVINVNTAALNALLTQFDFTSLGSSSNRLFGTPFSNDTASLNQTGAVQRSGLSGTASITVTAFDTDFLFPSSNPKTMRTAASDTFSFTSAGQSRTFQSFFDPTNSTPPGAGIASPLLAFIPPVGVGPFGTSNPGVDTPLGTQPIPFGLSNTTVITLGPLTSASAIPTDQFTGATTVTAVPEPVSGMLMLAGAGALAMRRRRRL